MTGSVFEVREASWTFWLNLQHILNISYYVGRLMTGSALRLEESRDGRRTRARRGKHLSSGGVQGGSGGGVAPPFSPGG